MAPYNNLTLSSFDKIKIEKRCTQILQNFSKTFLRLFSLASKSPMNIFDALINKLFFHSLNGTDAFPCQLRHVANGIALLQ